MPAARFSAGVAFGFRHPSPWERFAFWRWYRSSSACSYTSLNWHMCFLTFLHRTLNCLPRDFIAVYVPSKRTMKDPPG